MPVRLILVDDHKILRDGLRLRLQQEPDFAVVGEAANAAEAYDCVARELPDLAIIDLNLPGDNGIVVAGRLRAAWPNLRLLMLTGDPAASSAQAALLAGANGFVLKEDASEDLVRAVRVVMAGKTYLTPDAATVVAQALVAKPAAPVGPDLSERERAVLKGLAEGLGYKEIAAQLAISVKSVETYRARIVDKTGCSTRADLVRLAIRLGIASA